MAYAQNSDLLAFVTPDQLVQLTDDTKSGQLNQATVDAAIARATGDIESYCRARYLTPLQQSNEVTAICVDLTIYYLYTRRPQKMSETVRQRYEDAMAKLKDVAKGNASFDQPSPQATPQSYTGSAVVPRGERREELRFDDHNMRGYN